MDLSQDTDDLLANFPQWAALRHALAENDKDPQLWGELVSYVEGLVATQLNTLKTNPQLSELLADDFRGLLARFPYLTEFWKRFVAIEYSIEGLGGSVAILEEAVASFPSSCELWVDYLNVVISNNLRDEPDVRDLFKRAVAHVGRQFMSHPVWDLYLDWEAKHAGVTSLEYVQILLQVVQYPLHQYARYFESLYEITSNFTIEDLIPAEKLHSLLESSYPGKNLEDLDADQVKNISDAYFNEIFTSCYTRVTERWEYESQLTKQNFDLLPVSDEDMARWIRYLDFEESRGDVEQTKSLYERALVPTCSYETIWLKYLRYLIRHNQDTEYIVSQFNKGCDVFVSADQPSIRYMYAKFYELKLEDHEKARQIYISMIAAHPTEAYPIARYVRYLCGKLGDESTFRQLLKVLDVYTGKTADELDADFGELRSVLNMWNAANLVVEAARIQWLRRRDAKAARDVLFAYYKTELVRCSVAFWTFFFKFELAHKNTKNLANIVNYVKYYGQLPTACINQLLDEYREHLFRTGGLEQLQPNRELVRLILETDIESSTHMKHFLKARLSANRDEDPVNKRLVKENGHPGVVSEYRPRLVNPVDFDASILAQRDAAQMPRFTNVERATMPLKYLQMDETS
ncbi:hypothetical protein KL911_001194 [Ogataea haglerorum]|uniref:uncharacterized protein n=1 Tax=Ogataea haglerorum TaxID=1937702 RepID=UPI001C8A60B5|nr:uncharacterized protein KL911_001194 [Ogataea haglerorum]KAG7756392.1 hypothetical protein KL911_001194 [Ogataea haglerorum]